MAEAQSPANGTSSAFEGEGGRSSTPPPTRRLTTIGTGAPR